MLKKKLLSKTEDLKAKVFEKIKKDKIKPIAEWKFFLKKWVFWGGFALSVLFGALAISLIFYIVNVQDWDLYMRLHGSFLRFFIFSLPYFWIVLFFVFAFIAFYNYEHTDTGYKHDYFYVFISSVFISLSLGALLYRFGVSEWIDDVARERVTIYRNINNFQENMWMNPEKGLLSGRVLFLDMDGLKIEDMNGNVWNVDVLDVDLRKKGILNEGDIFKFVGEVREVGVFDAVDVRPWAKRLPMRKILLK